MAVQKTPNVLIDYAMYMRGKGKVGLTPKIKLPDLEKIVEDYSGNGFAGDLEIDMGKIEKMVPTITFAQIDADLYKEFGRPVGDDGTYVFRSALQGSEGVTQYKVTMIGRFKKMAFDEIEAKKLSNVDIDITCTGLKIELGGEKQVDIDIPGGKLWFGGRDLRADINTALGI